uniref:IF rod domain-containing protein n=1 Tax=Molossus molossus TaxID=27622 RepID=A0A7J8CZG2_MOLMO|nr:hypothetical protein HJG59_009495 [Molossus molossus]
MPAASVWGRPLWADPTSVCPSVASPPAPCPDIPGNVGSCGTYGEGTLNGHEKVTMQFLNDRLANYLEKVRQLERENAELETKIRERSQCHETTVCPNYQGYFRSIEELPQKEVRTLKCQLGDKLRIELDTEPTVDLSRVLDNMRCQYEAMVETNRRDVEQWFQAQSEGISLQATSCCEELQCCQSEILELRCTVNALEVERQAQHHLKDCLQNSLCESEARFGTELAQTQCLIGTVEAQLAEIRADLERQNQEYQVLLDVRARLEGEITTYRYLLESTDCKLPCKPCTTRPPAPLCRPCRLCPCPPCPSRPPQASRGPCSSPRC